MRKLWDYLSILFQIVGVVAAVLGTIQGISFLFFEKKAINASYKIAILAQQGPTFDAGFGSFAAPF